VSFMVYRPSQRDSSRLTASSVGGVDIFGEGEVVETVRDVRLPTNEGDVIGLEVPEDSTLWGVVTGQDDWSWEADAGDPFGIDTDDGYIGGLWLYNARVEADADGDGYGDETQDGCPSDGSTQGACPGPTGGGGGTGDGGGGGASGGTTGGGDAGGVGSGSAGGRPALKGPTLASRAVSATRTGGFSVRLNNPNPYRVSGKGTVKSGRKVVGSKNYSMAANRGATLRFKLSKQLARKLKRRRKLALSLIATAKGPRGTRPKTLRSRITVRPPAPRRRTPGGGGEGGGEGGGSGLDGKYAKPEGAEGASITFEVTGNGTRIRELGGTVVGSCFNPITGFEIRILSPYIPEMAVAPDGSFSGVYESDGVRTEVTNGRLASDATATGEVSVKFSGCSGKASFTSRKQ